MSYECPEIAILGQQMQKSLVGKVISSHVLVNVESLQKIGFLNKNLKDFAQLSGKTIQSVSFRGNLIRIHLNEEINLLFGPEYGGEITYHRKSPPSSMKFNLKLIFTDNTCITVHIKSMGLIYITPTTDLAKQYLYQRDFSEKLDPITTNFTREVFLDRIQKEKRKLKAILVGKDAIIVGISNSAFQDIVFRAKINPNTNTNELSQDQKSNLFDAITGLVRDRLNAHGKDVFRDLNGKPGEYIPLMGSNMKNKPCISCGTYISSMNLSGGVVFYCPKCQSSSQNLKKDSKKEQLERL